jgi:hypothetical protein
MTKTNLQLINFVNFARGFLQQHKEQTKFRYALERMEKRLAKPIEGYQEAVADLQIEHAATDETQAILTDVQGNVRYTKDGIRARNKAQRDLLENPVEIEPYMATEVPDDLRDAEKQACAGFVLPELPAPEEPNDNG